MGRDGEPGGAGSQLGACGDAPVLLVNNKRMCCGMHPADIDRLLEGLD